MLSSSLPHPQNVCCNMLDSGSCHGLSTLEHVYQLYMLVHVCMPEALHRQTGAGTNGSAYPRVHSSEVSHSRP